MEPQSREDIDRGNQWSLTQNSDPFNLGALIVSTQYRDEGRLKRKGLDSMWEQNNESVRYDQRYHNGDQGVFPRMSRTPGEVRQC